MKKMKAISAVLFIAALACVLAVGASARWWNDNPFDDVKSDAWYYDAVRASSEMGLFRGTSDTTFAPDAGITRAMFVTVLAATDGYDASEYTETPFDDVPNGVWYTAPVAWAAEKEITAGTGANTFSPERVITREELVTMLRKYALNAGYPTDAYEQLGNFRDFLTVSEWADEPFAWAVAKGIISGVANGNERLLAPKMTVTRSQVAQMMVKFLATKPAYRINGNDLSDYVIVYNKDVEGSEDTSEESAEKLAGYIKASLGLELPIVSDETEPSEYEILIGETNRESAGLVTVDRDAFENDQQFLCQVQGNRLVIAGIDTNPDQDDGSRTTNNVSGTRNAVFYFGERILGVETYSTSNGGIYKYSPNPVISLEDGWTYIDGPYFRGRTFYMSGGILGTGRYYSKSSYGLGVWVTGDFAHEENYYHAATPCLTNEDNIQAVINNVRAFLERKPKKNCIGIGINDDHVYCLCDNCREAYRKYGSRSATLCLIVNRVAEALHDDYPNVKFDTGAYSYTVKPPKNIKMHDNVIIEFYTIDACYNHTYTDTTCELNRDIEKYVDGWNAIANELWLWDHNCNFEYAMCSVPDWDSMRENIRFFAESGATEVLMNSLLGGGYRYSDFGYLRGYILSALYRDPYMSEEEYNYRLNTGLEAYYGPKWTNIREYLDFLCDASNGRCHSRIATPAGYYDYSMIVENVDHLNDLWAETKAAAEAVGDTAMVERITLAESSWIFLRQCATHEDYCVNGTPEQRAAYEKANEDLYNYIVEHDIQWTEETLNPIDNYGPDNAPYTW